LFAAIGLKRTIVDHEAVAAFSIRRAACSDVREILACLRAAFAPYESQYSPDGFMDTVLTEHTLEARLDAMTVFVAVDRAGRIVGTLGCGVQSGREGHLRGMAVTPVWQQRGVASRLLKIAEDHLRSCDCTCVTLDTTHLLTRAAGFYLRHGYQPTGKVGAYFGMPLIEYRKMLASAADREHS
jgi:N-acetylglutamate synthase-like GNAT family acetyltransferase